MLLSWSAESKLLHFCPLHRICKAEVWTANSLLQLFWILDRNRETNCHRLLIDFLTLLIQHAESSLPQTFSLRLLTSSTICTSHHLGLKCTQNNLAQVVKRWIVLSAGPRLFKRSIAQLVFLILIHWIVIYMVDGAIQCLNIRDQINLYPVDNTTLLISLKLFISWIVIGLVDSTIQPSKLKSLLGHHLATNPFGLGRLFYKSIR